MSDEVQSISVADLIEAGLLRHTARLHGYYGQLRIEATLKRDGTFVCDEVVSSSPSVAAGRAITAKSGQRTPGRTYLSVNGWIFWRVTGRGENARTLADLRRELVETRQRLAGRS